MYPVTIIPIYKSLLSHNLVCMADFSSFEQLLLLWNSIYVAQIYFVWPQLKDVIYFHDKIWNKRVIYSHLRYIHHYTPVTLLLCCGNIKDWFIEIDADFPFD